MGRVVVGVMRSEGEREGGVGEEAVELSWGGWFCGGGGGGSDGLREAVVWDGGEGVDGSLFELHSQPIVGDLKVVMVLIRWL